MAAFFSDTWACQGFKGIAKLSVIPVTSSALKGSHCTRCIVVTLAKSCAAPWLQGMAWDRGKGRQHTQSWYTEAAGRCLSRPVCPSNHVNPMLCCSVCVHSRCTSCKRLVYKQHQLGMRNMAVHQNLVVGACGALTHCHVALCIDTLPCCFVRWHTAMLTHCQRMQDEMKLMNSPCATRWMPAAASLRFPAQKVY